MKKRVEKGGLGFLVVRYDWPLMQGTVAERTEGSGGWMQDGVR